MEPISFGNIDLKDFDNQLGLESNFRSGVDRSKKVK